MYTVLKKDSTGSAFFLWLEKDTRAYVVKHDFSNLEGFPKEALVRMAHATGVSNAQNLSADELVAAIRQNVTFE